MNSGRTIRKASAAANWSVDLLTASGRGVFQIAVVSRQIVERLRTKSRPARDGRRQLAVDGFAAQAADEDCDVIVFTAWTPWLVPGDRRRVTSRPNTSIESNSPLEAVVDCRVVWGRGVKDVLEQTEAHATGAAVAVDGSCALVGRALLRPSAMVASRVHFWMPLDCR